MWQRRLTVVGDLPKVTQITRRGQKLEPRPMALPTLVGLLGREGGLSYSLSLKPLWLPVL